MKEFLERKEAQECIEAVKNRFMQKAVRTDISDDERREAAQQYQLVDRVVAELSNYKPED